MTASILAVAVLLGLARAAAPGPANAEALRLARTQGARTALLVQAGSLAGDLGWAVLAFLGLAMMLQDATLRVVLAAAGGLVLLGTGIGALRGAATDTGEPEIDPAGRRPGAGPFGTGAGFAATRVMAPVLWLGVGSWLGGALPLDGPAVATAGFLAAFAAGWLAWAVPLAWLGARGALPPRRIRVADAAAGVGLLGLGGLLVAAALGVRLPGLG